MTSRHSGVNLHVGRSSENEMGPSVGELGQSPGYGSGWSSSSDEVALAEVTFWVQSAAAAGVLQHASSVVLWPHGQLWWLWSAKNQPWVQFQRKNVGLPANTSYNDLSAFLTTANTEMEVEGFPYLLGYEANATVNHSRLELIPVAAISIHLFTRNGSAIEVSGPIQVSVPLPADNLVTKARDIPAWKFDRKIGE
ncbi:protein FAM171A2-like [Rhincodon typus]|uniref:protein FAM171A2-like n=1 Tax=Rhincodon typus TaxID=259920 RepID=UPI00202F195B|nr:protein FAM171A2-like [Rhincodon typus]